MIVDRIEGNIAVVENDKGEHIEIPLRELPNDIREGSVLKAAEGGYIHDIEAEEKRRQEMAAKTKRLFKRK